MNKHLNVCVGGATGWTGLPLSREILKTKDLSLVGAVSRKRAGENFGEILDQPNLNLIIQKSVGDALTVPTDVYIDFTSANVVKDHVLTALNKRVHVVVGSSGLTDQDYLEIHEAALQNGVGVVACGNFATSAILLQRFACQAARFLSHWEVIDYAAAGKPDSPSGMARQLAFRLSEIRKPEMERPISSTVGPVESRGATLNDTQIHSIRLPGFVIGLEVLFGEKDERLSIRYDAGASPAPYLAGALIAIRNVGSSTGLIRGIDSFLFQ
ncbi:4-hydroxy-tetrahydrodipicolinate reductase [bacterium]|nr:4-hydroxy-tetrahydrodipicolinate reductase [bacterium]MCI0601434.1 4-hydroxy-tetrahydrodipicolinate reductase [bacterium]